MNLLLDTHTFLWTLFEPSKISRKALTIIEACENNVFVSVISFWEISLKYGLGKLELIGVKPENLPNLAMQMQMDILPIDPAEAASFYKMPKFRHKDPFDRLIAWQAIHRGLTLVSKDRAFEQYRNLGLMTLW